jgi:hypothetical protein
MYEVRKHVKMKVSLSRKIHIIALPHGTGKACLSADQSATTPGRPAGAAPDSSAAARELSATAPRKASVAVESEWVVRTLSAFSAIRMIPDQVDNNTANNTSQTSRR